MKNSLTQNAWRWKCNLEETEVKSEKVTLSYEEIKKDQWNFKFEKLRLNRMILGFFRYGFIKGNSKKYDNIGSAIKRLEKYQETGNSEYLVDAANLCMIEFTQENHENFHFDSIDDGEHTKQIK
jgi:hypothetical protein